MGNENKQKEILIKLHLATDFENNFFLVEEISEKEVFNLNTNSLAKAVYLCMGFTKKFNEEVRFEER